MPTGYTPTGYCFYCGKPTYSFQVEYVAPTTVGLVTLCREHAKGNPLARARQATDRVVTRQDIARWKGEKDR